MKKNIKYLVLVLLFIIVIIYNNSSSFADHLKEDYFPDYLQGKIYDMMPIKGGSVALMMHTQNGDDDITVMNSEVRPKIKKGMYFKKLPNTNQCYVIKGDSIMYFNCFDRSFLIKEDSIKVGKIKEWQPTITNHWLLKNKQQTL